VSTIFKIRQDAEENKMPLQKKIFSPSRDFPFKPLKHLSKGLKHLSKGLEHMFQALEHKFSLRVNYFSPNGK
jgi:hypothetical protein